MGKTTPIAANDHVDVMHALDVLEHVGASRKKLISHEPGRLDVVRILKEVHKADLEASEVELVYSARTTSKQKRVQQVRFIFQDQGKPPEPTLDEGTATMRLYYARNELNDVLNTLRSRKVRFCYFWQAADASHMRAWLFTSL